MMQQQIFILLIISGFLVFVSSVPRKYYLVQQNKTWSEAQTFCRINHTDLATIETPADMTKLQTVAQQQQFSSDAWIGLYRHFHDWRWSMGNESLGSSTPWCAGQPDNNGGIEECAYTSSTCWADNTCTKSLYYICFDDSNVGTNRYILYSASKPWHVAQANCRTYHTDLASAKDTAEITAVEGKAAGWCWIGLSKNSWSWSDQTSTNIIMWGPGSPSSVGTNPYCGYVNQSKVFDSLCSAVKPFFCFSVITAVKQIMMIKVQSDQDVNDPALMALILDQILQKLREGGLDNITVKWRQQPNKKIFYKLKNTVQNVVEPLTCHVPAAASLM